MVNNAKMNNYKMNDANGQLKSRSKVQFPMKGSKNSPLYSSRQWIEMLNCQLDLESENQQVKIMLPIIASGNEYKTQV